jgi:hypothetical protein
MIKGGLIFALLAEKKKTTLNTDYADEDATHVR